MTSCPLCGAEGTLPAPARPEGCYHRCPGCGLHFADPAERPDAETELARYRTHQNDPRDAGYRAFLDRLAVPLVERLTRGAEGLDYGAGPGPTLSLMLTERGFPTADWDPFFAPVDERLGRTWDFVTCTEVVEHFFRPDEEFERLDRLVRPGGWLGVMTEVLHDDVDFATWWYPRDPTHVCFYAPRTLAWIARRHGWALETPHRNVALYRKSGGADVR